MHSFCSTTRKSLKFHLRYYETCTRNELDMDERLLVSWCPAPRQGNDTETVIVSDPVDYINKCNRYAGPEDNGCNDHYDRVRN